MLDEFEVYLILGSSGEWDTYDEWYVSDEDGSISWFGSEDAATVVCTFLNKLAEAKDGEKLTKIDADWSHNADFYQLDYIVVHKKFRKAGG